MTYLSQARSSRFVDKTPILIFVALLSLQVCGKASASAPLNQQLSDLIDPKSFDDEGLTLVTTLEEMQEKNLASARLTITPWSGSSWPVYKGVLGNRYASPGFVKAGNDWPAYNAYVSTQTLSDVVARNNFDELDRLSPSEKYDLLLGHFNEHNQLYDRGYLTTYMWSEGAKHIEDNGKIERWNGICHGWAPASIFTPRPRRTVPAATPDGSSTIRFYPSDLKALSSFLWSRFHFPVRVLGERCDSAHPAKDPSSGHVLEPACAGINPSLWHMAMVNQLGVAHRALVLNVTQTSAISNQPVFAYSYQFFNLKNGKVVDLEAATIPIGEYARDKFNAFRAPDTAFIVGVRMNVTYTVVSQPNHSEVDTPENDTVKKVSYVYDLELDSQHKIIGGEWHKNHAAFVWTPQIGTHAMAAGEAAATPSGEPAWTPALPIPAFWREIAIRTATTSGEPLAAIIDPLIAESNPNGN